MRTNSLLRECEMKNRRDSEQWEWLHLFSSSVLCGCLNRLNVNAGYIKTSGLQKLIFMYISLTIVIPKCITKHMDQPLWGQQ